MMNSFTQQFSYPVDGKNWMASRMFEGTGADHKWNNLLAPDVIIVDETTFARRKYRTKGGAMYLNCFYSDSGHYTFGVQLTGRTLKDTGELSGSHD